MYRLVTLNKTPAKRQLMNDDAFDQVLNFLISESHHVTLREIKRALPQLNDIEKKMEDWVNLGVISRHHGRYSLIGDTISSGQQSEKMAMLEVSFKNWIKVAFEQINALEITTKERSFYLIHALMSQLDCNEPSIYFIEQSPGLDDILSLPVYLQKLSGIKTEIYSYERLGDLADTHTLASYFYEQRYQVSTNSQMYTTINRLLGDVNPSYFVHYVERKLRRIKKGRQIPIASRDIFLESLLALNYLTDNDGYYDLNLTVITDDLLNQFKTIVQPLFDDLPLNEIDLLYLVGWLKSKGLVDDEPVLVGVYEFLGIKVG